MWLGFCIMFNWVINMKEMKYIAFGLIGAVFIDGIAFTIFSLASGKYGDLADWVSGLGTLAAFFAVIWQQRRQEQLERASKIEQSRARFMYMYRGVLPEDTNVLLDDNDFFNSLGDQKDCYLRLIVKHPTFFDIPTFENISPNTIYSFEMIIYDEYGEKFYWSQNGLKKNAIVIPIPIVRVKGLKTVIEKRIISDKTKETTITLKARELKIRFTTSFSETCFYQFKFKNNEEKYYFINETGNNLIRAGRNGKMLDKRSKEAKELNDEFDIRKKLNTGTVPYFMLIK